MKHIILIMVMISVIFIAACGNKKNEIEESYLVELENQYASSSTEDDDIYQVHKNAQAHTQSSHNAPTEVRPHP